MLASDASLRITEIFCSIQGESSLVGERTVFVRLTGCPLRCVYCDTAYAFQGGEQILLADILLAVDKHNTRNVCVTGGEPLAQPNCSLLLTELCNQGYKVSLETSGAIDISNIDSRVKRIVDLKTPSSQESGKNLNRNIDFLTANDELKFVIANREDYEWACEQIQQHQLDDKAGLILFSPAFAIGESFSEGLEPVKLAEWILADRLPVRLQLQMHKLLWGDEPGH